MKPLHSCQYFTIFSGGHIWFLATHGVTFFPTEESYQKVQRKIKELEDKGIWKCVINKEYPPTSEIRYYLDQPTVVLAMKVLK